MGDWKDRGACAGTGDPELFYPVSEDHAAQVHEAMTVCRHCPVILQCREEALERREKHGIWGGTTPREREAYHRARQRRKAAA